MKDDNIFTLDQVKQPSLLAQWYKVAIGTIFGRLGALKVDSRRWAGISRDARKLTRTPRDVTLEPKKIFNGEC